MAPSRSFGFLIALALLALAIPAAAQSFVVYEGTSGPGKGKHIVLVSGDEEYRSEEALPMLGRILAGRFGFKCTVLFPIEKATGFINPDILDHIPGISALQAADLMIAFLRFREWPDADMKYFVDFLESGKPIIGIRTATHAFNYVKNPTSPYARYSFQNSGFPGGFGRQVLGETWVNHWGSHGSQSTRGVVRAASKDHAILKGIADVWGPSDVYEVKSLPANAQVLLDGQVLAGMKPTDPPLAGKATMPIAWIRTYTGNAGRVSRVFTTTIGAATDFQSEDLRRLLVNACFWGLALESAIPPRADVTYMSPYAPSAFGFGRYRKGVKPADLAANVSSALRLPGAAAPPGNILVTPGPIWSPDGRRMRARAGFMRPAFPF